jgi:acetyl-CoA carboxylase biotin carboxyl carrier protein
MAPRPPARVPADTVADLARRLAALLSELGLTEIEATVGGVHVRVQRQSSAAPSPAVVAVPALAHPAPVTDVAAATAVSAVTIEAPMVGTFYRASSPTAEPYVREGDAVKEGQILCIIEAMKLMNEIESRTGGRIAKILVENGQPVEYGQPLFLIEPTA